MINYALDTQIRKTTILIIAAISYFAHGPFNYILEKIYNGICFLFPFSIKTFYELSIIGIELSEISMIGLFGILYYLFVNIIWKFKFISKLTRIPNLTGIWDGTLISSYVDVLTNEKVPAIAFTAEIKQNWNSISIICKFPESTSYSQSASIHVNDKKGTVLCFSYFSQSKKVELTAREYTGYNELAYYENSLNGIYFTNRGDGTHGTISLTKSNS